MIAPLLKKSNFCKTVSVGYSSRQKRFFEASHEGGAPFFIMGAKWIFISRNEVVKMNEKENLIIRENAYKDYISGKKYSEIAEKYNVSINTIKSWKRRFNWQRNSHTKKGAKAKSVQELGNKIADEIKEDLLKQLNENETYGKHYEDLVNDYMALWDIKNRLIDDIKERGVSVEWNNGKQTGKKKNDSISELNKTSAQMLKILNDLGLKPSIKDGDGDYDL